MLIPEEAEVIRHLPSTSAHQLEVASTLLSGWPAVKKGGCLHWQAEIAALLGLIWTESSRRRSPAKLHPVRRKQNNLHLLHILEVLKTCSNMVETKTSSSNRELLLLAANTNIKVDRGAAFMETHVTYSR